jgi:hypothetical protein
MRDQLKTGLVAFAASVFVLALFTVAVLDTVDPDFIKCNDVECKSHN